MNILHISDMHFCISYRESKTEYERMLHKMQSPQIPLEFCLRRALARYPVDLLIITGDLTDEGTPEDYQRLRQLICGNLPEGLPLVVTLGNHDNKAAFRQGWLGVAPSCEKYNTVYETDALAVLSFDSSESESSDGRIGREQVKWLERELECRREKPVVLMTHHHLDERQASIGPAQYEGDFLDLLHFYHPVCILNGHTHHQAQGRIGDIPYYTCAGMSFCGEDIGNGIVRFEEKYGFNWYHIEGRTVKKSVSETFCSGRILGNVCWE